MGHERGLYMQQVKLAASQCRHQRGDKPSPHYPVFRIERHRPRRYTYDPVFLTVAFIVLRRYQGDLMTEADQFVAKSPDRGRHPVDAGKIHIRYHQDMHV